MKKKWLLLVLSCTLLFTIVSPSTGQASEMSKVNKELRELQQQMKAAENKQQQAEDTLAVAESGKKKTQADMQVIVKQIDKKANELASVSTQIDESETNLEQNAKLLEEANHRIADREKLLDTRVQLMYTNGNVSYLDVLFSSTSFMDFLDRLSSLEQIANQDKQILEEHKRDKQLVLDKKKEIEDELKRVRLLYAKLEQTKLELMKQEREKEVMIASFDQQIEESHGLSDEQDRLLVEFAMKRSELMSKKKKIADQEEAERRAREEAARKAREQSGSNTGSNSDSGSGSNGADAGGKLGVPLRADYYISSPFGSRVDPITGSRGAFHSGLDMATPGGTNIYAADDGVVILAEWWSGYGYCVIIDHGNGLWTLYGHIRKGGIKVDKGQDVKRGEKIAEVGATGRATGNHLHFEVRLNGEKVDPAPYLK
ncbi:murein hydrolase activator EnvC family protein [Paenibacillus taiwanensis]|uniref:murein hydrolase activator EnvC family protein n=1 Tax=Paenibacillus taiwanensis TaxID=401638 RepID=UPI0004135676|nr:M23 family metallopeptidase [Paenibacillus taiwanensis]